MHFSSLFLKRASYPPPASPETKAVVERAVKAEGVNPFASQQGSHLPADFGKDHEAGGPDPFPSGHLFRP